MIQTFLLVGMMSALSVGAQVLSPQEREPCERKFCFYSALPKISAYFEKSKIAELLQNAADQLYGTGFVKMGTYADFMHGHVLLDVQEDGTRAPFAIFYHTQERLFSFMVEYTTQSENQKYAQELLSRLDSRYRNFIQFLKAPDTIENAAKYLVDHISDSYFALHTNNVQEQKNQRTMIEAVRAYSSESLPLEAHQRGLSFGFSSALLDPVKVGTPKNLKFQSIEDYESFNIEFFEASCDQFVSNQSQDNLIQVSVNGQNVCLYLSERN